MESTTNEAIQNPDFCDMLLEYDSTDRPLEGFATASPCISREGNVSTQQSSEGVTRLPNTTKHFAASVNISPKVQENVVTTTCRSPKSDTSWIRNSKIAELLLRDQEEVVVLSSTVTQGHRSASEGHLATKVGASKENPHSHSWMPTIQSSERGKKVSFESRNPSFVNVEAQGSTKAQSHQHSHQDQFALGPGMTPQNWLSTWPGPTIMSPDRQCTDVADEQVVNSLYEAMEEVTERILNADDIEGADVEMLALLNRPLENFHAVVFGQPATQETATGCDGGGEADSTLPQGLAFGYLPSQMTYPSQQPSVQKRETLNQQEQISATNQKQSCSERIDLFPETFQASPINENWNIPDSWTCLTPQERESILSSFDTGEARSVLNSGFDSTDSESQIAQMAMPLNFRLESPWSSPISDADLPSTPMETDFIASEFAHVYGCFSQVTPEQMLSSNQLLCDGSKDLGIENLISPYTASSNALSESSVGKLGTSDLHKTILPSKNSPQEADLELIVECFQNSQQNLPSSADTASSSYSYSIQTPLSVTTVEGQLTNSSLSPIEPVSNIACTPNPSPASRTPGSSSSDNSSDGATSNSPEYPKDIASAARPVDMVWSRNAGESILSMLLGENLGPETAVIPLAPGKMQMKINDQSRSPTFESVAQNFSLFMKSGLTGIGSLKHVPVGHKRSGFTDKAYQQETQTLETVDESCICSEESSVQIYSAMSNVSSSSQLLGMAQKTILNQKGSKSSKKFKDTALELNLDPRPDDPEDSAFQLKSMKDLLNDIHSETVPERSSNPEDPTFFGNASGNSAGASVFESIEGKEADERRPHLGTETCDKGSDSEPVHHPGTHKRPPDKILPPCRVCAQPATGIHYGVNTCEACKGFFRRSLMRKKPYKCKGNQKCNVLLTTRSSCASCRYRRCLDVGMSQQAIKTGRYSNETRTQHIMEVQRQRALAAGGHVSCPSITQADLDQLVARLLAADQRVLTNTDVPDDVIETRSKKVFEIYTLQKETFGLKLLSNEEYQDVYRRTGIDVDGRKAMIEFYALCLDRSIRNYVRFSRHVPEFPSLATADQLSLLKAARVEFWFLGSYRGFHQSYRTFFAPNGVVFNPLQYFHITGQDLFEYQFRMANKLRKWDVTREELVLVKAVCLTYTDRCPLENPGKVEKIQYYLLKSLYMLLARRHGHNASRALAKALDHLVALRDLTEITHSFHRGELVLEVLREHPALMEVLQLPM